MASMCIDGVLIEKRAGTKVGGLRYRGVSKISESGMSLSFLIFCPGWFYTRVMMGLNRELKLMCDRNHIRIAQFFDPGA